MPIELNQRNIIELTDEAIPKDWTRMWPANLKFKLMTKDGTIDIAVESIQAHNGMEVTLYLK